jgi:two-component system cell cycle response regulator CpdR
MTNTEKQILLADDDDGLRSFLARALEKEGYIVHQANDGDTALAVIESEKHNIDLLLTDIVMPALDGVELARKCLIINPNIKVIYITGFSAMTQVNTSHETMKVISKPFHLNDIVKEVNKAFAK